MKVPNKKSAFNTQKTFTSLLSCAVLILLVSSIHLTDNTRKIENSDKLKPKNFSKKMKILIDSNTFSVSLNDSKTAEEFLKILPIKIEMKDLNQNEKYYLLPKNLPSDARNPGTIHKGDLMLWGSNTLVIFYKTFSTSYSYTKIGKIDDPSGLAEALGAGSCSITFQSID
jgi:hypothetical protein